ncbi:hypothetical protein BU25DRAFT_410640 [Macroventuria anomochaeta]|uniref:Uncharacterized protein n=1 Tax=Macroventuria anomochaeta TaxID=301207 RepID=A0ACB6S1J0_9PLEO|nr:uncharacterized protein BU25DRAFT_410640 [Macroventuria anomochaeta]KAF2628016.1 hypothetical protein BU25DRAFT_410640 [Macroventuria anomochaeta]
MKWSEPQTLLAPPADPNYPSIHGRTDSLAGQGHQAPFARRGNVTTGFFGHVHRTRKSDLQRGAGFGWLRCSIALDAIRTWNKDAKYALDEAELKCWQCSNITQRYLACAARSTSTFCLMIRRHNPKILKTSKYFLVVLSITISSLINETRWRVAPGPRSQHSSFHNVHTLTKSRGV